MPDKDLVLGFDFGTSSVKAAAFALDGTVVAEREHSYPIYFPRPGWVEQKPEDWWTAMCAVTQGMMKEIGDGANRIAALGISAQMCGVIPVDRDGHPLADCLTWMDTRSGDIARKTMGGLINISGYGASKLARWLLLTGGAPNLSGKDPITKYIWLQRERADIWPAIHKFLDVKDYIVHRCTGRFATTYDSAHLTWLFDSRPGKKRWSRQLLDRMKLNESLLPDIVSGSEVVGTLTSRAADELGLRAGTPLAGGLGDVGAAAAGAGNPEDGSLHCYVGTSFWLASTLQRSRVDPFASIGSICQADGTDYMLIATQESAGASLRWGMQMLGVAQHDFEAMEALAANAEPRRDAAMFFPWLAGERVPVDDPRIGGGFANLSLNADRAQIAYAVYEGVVLNARWAMESFDKLSGRKGQPLRMVGGGGKSRYWAKLFADILGRPIERVIQPELCGARGSAITAAIAVGLFANLRAASAMTRVAERIAPDSTTSDLYRERFAMFSRFYGRVRPWYWARGPQRDAGSA